MAIVCVFSSPSAAPSLWPLSHYFQQTITPLFHSALYTEQYMCPFCHFQDLFSFPCVVEELSGCEQVRMVSYSELLF